MLLVAAVFFVMAQLVEAQVIEAQVIEAQTRILVKPTELRLALKRWDVMCGSEANTAVFTAIASYTEYWTLPIC